MRNYQICSISVLALGFFGVASPSFAQTDKPTGVTKTIQASPELPRWNGWAQTSRSVPGWGNKPPEPGTVTVTTSALKEPRTFLGRVEGLKTNLGAEVGVVSLSYIYWIRQRETYHWVPLHEDGTFNITDEKFLDENKSVVLRAPGHPWTFLPYIFKAPEGGTDIVLHAEPGKAVRVTVDIAGVPAHEFGVEQFAFNEAWIHSNNPAGYQWASRARTSDDSDGSVTLYLPLHPIGLYVSCQGAANDWEIVDAREADHYHFSLLPEAMLKLTVYDKGIPVPNTPVSLGNEAAAFSLRGGKTNESGQLEIRGMAPGTWWMDIGKNKTVEFDVSLKQVVQAGYDLDLKTLKVAP